MSIVDNEGIDKSPYLVSGLIFLLYGASIYIFLPLALLNANFGLMLLIFFGILIASIFGLALFASNF